MITGFILTLVLALVDDRVIDGTVSVWAKPLKFALSLAIHATTLALVISTLSASLRSSATMVVIAMAFLAACIVEMGYIISQAARAEHSHFNMSTPFNRFMWSVMAIAAIMVIGAAGAIGVAVAFDVNAGLSPALRWAIALGLIGGTLLTLYTAFTIGARMSPYVGAIPSDGGARMAFTGWSLIAGDLRVSHFLATHMIQVLPLIGLAIANFSNERVGVAVVVASALGWSTLTLAEYSRALSGQASLLAFSTPTTPR
ncbi:MAG: hypothetical protein JXQ99_23510 [Hyphomicrobiaceae bacterium]